jgi:hypothetical protein
MKYTEIAMDYMFQPIAVKNLGHINGSAVEFLEEFENRLGISSGEERQTAYPFQRNSVAVQRFNSVLLHGTLLATTRTNSPTGFVFNLSF